jgi:hypothetical protein
MPADMARDREIVVEFEIDRPVSPAELGISADTRQLGFGLKAIEITARTGKDGTQRSSASNTGGNAP